jgi:hypothetical protein
MFIYSQDSWRGDASQEEDSSSANFVPPKSWTAWPLNSDVVPRTGEQLDSRDETDVWTLKSTEDQKPSFELEETLMGIVLKIAKERFVKRERGPCPGSAEALQEREIVACEDVHGATNKIATNFGQNFGQGISEKHPSGLTGGVTEEPDVVEGASVHTEEGADEHPDNSSIAKDNPEPTSKRTCWPAHPSVSADDERSRLLLRPSIRHTLERLDAVLLALHHARQTCLHYTSERTDSQTEAESGRESTNERQSSSRSPMPSSVGANLPILSQEHRGLRIGQPQNIIDNPASNELTLLERDGTPEKKKRGRKRHMHVPQEGETQQEMRLRIARSQKKAIPFPSPAPSGNNSSSPRKASLNGFRKQGTSSQTRGKRSTRLGLRDWSEVLGAAALVGISPEVVERSTQRCANLFGEGMTLRSLANNTILGDFEEDTVHYLPWQVPVLDNSSDSGLTDTGSDERRAQVQKRSARRSYHRQRTSKKDSSDTDSEDIKMASEARTTSESYRCTYDWCIRSEHAFDRKDRLLRHMKSVHKVKKDEMKEALEENDEEMDGGVHVDGFMKEIRRRKGWRGTDGDQRKRSKKAELPESGEVSSPHKR